MLFLKRPLQADDLLQRVRVNPLQAFQLALQICVALIQPKPILFQDLYFHYRVMIILPQLLRKSAFGDEVGFGIDFRDVADMHNANRFAGSGQPGAVGPLNVRLGQRVRLAGTAAGAFGIIHDGYLS